MKGPVEDWNCWSPAAPGHEGLDVDVVDRKHSPVCATCSSRRAESPHNAPVQLSMSCHKSIQESTNSSSTTAFTGYGDFDPAPQIARRLRHDEQLQWS